MFGLGIPEILFIVLLAVLILGPEQMPRAAKWIGQMSGKIRSAATSLNAVVNEDKELRELQSNFHAVKSDLSMAKKELLAPVKEVEEVIQTGRTEFVKMKQDVASTGESLGLDASSKSSQTGNVTDAEANSDDAQESSEGLKSSPFMHRPLSWFDDDEKTAGENTQGHQHFVLKKHRLLPGKIARQVNRISFSLSPARNISEEFIQTRSFVLQKARPGRALICRYTLQCDKTMVKRCKRIALKQPQNSDLRHLSVHLPEVR